MVTGVSGWMTMEQLASLVFQKLSDNELEESENLPRRDSK